LHDGKKNAPRPRSGHSANLWGDKMVIFGGIDQDRGRLNDTWVFDFNNKTWQYLTIKTNGFYLPRVRSGHSASIYKENYLVVFGGITAVTKELDDVCALNLVTKEWSQITEPK
jgi:N-acetylneuraminic acid mutarotase